MSFKKKSKKKKINNRFSFFNFNLTIDIILFLCIFFDNLNKYKKYTIGMYAFM